MKMEQLLLLIALPLITAGCELWQIGENKYFYIGPSDQMLQVVSGTTEQLYIIKNINLKSVACMAKALNTTLGISGLPELSRVEITKLCEIPDYCFQRNAQTAEAGEAAEPLDLDEKL